MFRVLPFTMPVYAVLLCVVAASPLAARTLEAGPEASLQSLIARAAPGDSLRIAAGRYRVHLHVTKSLTLIGTAGTVLDGEGHGNVIRVSAPDVTLRGLSIINSGHDLTTMDAGVFVDRRAGNVRIEHNSLDGNGFGIWLDGCPGPRVIDNRIHGTPQLRSQDRGNGIHLYNIHDGVIRGNEIWETRDGIYLDTTDHTLLAGNHMHDLRYGVHYMYSYNNELRDNYTHHTRTGYALMQSRHLTVVGNRSDHDRNYGILMNYITYSTIEGNVITGVHKGLAFVNGGGEVSGADGKALFVYNSEFDLIRGNTFEDSDIGIHLTAGSDGDEIYGNDFIANQTQVKYVASRTQEWSYHGRGNFWSDYIGWDLNADGIGDLPYEPNDAVDKVLWKYPLARILMRSPSVDMLRWAQRQFPVLRPQGVQDSHPLMRPVVRAGGRS